MIKTGLVYKRYATQKKIGEVQGFNFGVGIMGPPFMTAWCYYVDGLLIDTGISRLRKQAVEMICRYKPSKIVLTHHHEDHSGNACAISNKLKIPVYGHPYALKKLSTPYPINFYQHLLWGKSAPVKLKLLTELIETKNHKFIPIHTPGHSRDHTVYLEKNKGWLFSGDLYLGSKIKFFRKDEIFSLQLSSLKKILTYDFSCLYCAHNPRLSGGKKLVQQKFDFLENLSGTIIHLHDKGYSEKEIIQTLDKKEDRFVKFLTVSNVSFENMVKSVLNSMTA